MEEARNIDHKPSKNDEKEPERWVVEVEIVERLPKIRELLNGVIKEIDPHENGLSALIDHSTTFDNKKYTDEHKVSAHNILFFVTQKDRHTRENLSPGMVVLHVFAPRPHFKEKDYQKVGEILQFIINEVENIKSRKDLIERLEEERQKWQEQSPKGIFSRKRKEKRTISINGFNKAIKRLKELGSLENNAESKKN